MRESKQIKCGAILSYVAIAVNIVITLVYTPWMKNQIGISNYGLYTLATSFISMFMLDFGISASVARFVAIYRSEHDQKKINDFVGLIYKLYLMIDVIIFIILTILFFFLDSIYAGLTLEEMSKFKILYVVVSAFSLFSLPFTTLSGIFNAYEKFVALKLCDLLNKLLSIVLIIFALINDFGVVAMVIANAIAGIITIIVKLIILHRTTIIKINWEIRDRQLLKTVLGFSVWTFILGIAQRLTYNVAPTILGIVSDSYQIALYSPASAIAGYFYTFATAINGLFLPTITRKIVAKREEEILPLMIKVGRFQVIVLGLLYVGFWVVGKEFMCLWMGKEFEKCYYCVLLLSLPTIFDYSEQIAATTLVAQNKVNLQAIGLLITGFLNICISPFLSRIYGVYGVSIAILIVAIINLIYINIIYYKKLKIDVFIFYKECYLSISFPIIGSILLSTIIVSWLPHDEWIWLIVKSMITAIIFLLLVFAFHLKKDERKKYLSIKLK